MSLNTKTFLIDADAAKTQSFAGSTTSATLTLYRGTEFVLAANVYSDATSSNVCSYANASGWTLNIGRVYGAGADPVLVESNAASWNQVTDYASANVAAGIICCRVNTAGVLISTDLANSSSQAYTMEIWYLSNCGSNILIVSDDLNIHNATII